MSTIDEMEAEVWSLAKARRGERSKQPGDVEHRDSLGRRYWAPPKKDDLAHHPARAHLHAAEAALRESGHHDAADRVARAHANLGAVKRTKKTVADWQADLEANPSPVIRVAKLGVEATKAHYAGHTVRRLESELRRHQLGTPADFEAARKHPDGRHAALLDLLVSRAHTRLTQNRA